MIYNIRNNSDETILDVEIWVESYYGDVDKCVRLNTSIDIVNYSKFLIDNIQNSKNIIFAFDKLLNLNDWMDNVYFNNRDNDGTDESGIELIVSSLLKNTSDMFNLKYVED